MIDTRALLLLVSLALASSTRSPGPDWSLFAAQAGNTDPPSPIAGMHFSGVFTDNAVLQKSDSQAAAVYGVSFREATKISASVSVLVEEAGKASYTLKAEVRPVPGHNNNVTWKALLRPHSEQGGNLTITATCASCSSNATLNTAQIQDVTYGDVWFCSGQVKPWTWGEGGRGRERLLLVRSHSPAWNPPTAVSLTRT